MFLNFSLKSLVGLVQPTAISLAKYFDAIFLGCAILLALISILIIIVLCKSIKSAVRKRHIFFLIIGLIFFLGLLSISFLIVFEDLSILSISELLPLYEIYGKTSVSVLHICLLVLTALQIVLVAVKPRKQKKESEPPRQTPNYIIRVSELDDFPDETVEVNDMFKEFGEGTKDVKERIENITASLMGSSGCSSDEDGITVDIFDGIERVLGDE